MFKKIRGFYEEHEDQIKLIGTCVVYFALAVPATVAAGYLQAKVTGKHCGRETARVLLEAGVDLHGQGR